jgi:hypothetical protein
MKSFSVIIISLLLFSCATKKRCYNKFPPPEEQIVVEKTSYKEIIKDTTIYIYNQPDTIKLIKMVECDSLNKAQLKEQIIESDKAIIKVKIIDSKVNATAICKEDSLMQVVSIYKKTIKENTLKKEVKIVKEKYIPKFYYFLAGALAFLLLFIGFYIGFKFF